MVSDRLKNLIFKRLYKELSKVEIIPYRDSIYFIDRDNKYWYFEYEKDGKLWYRYDFFKNFFVLFSLEWYEYEKVMGEWVEEVLNCKVTTISSLFNLYSNQVEEVINCKVTKIVGYHKTTDNVVEEVLAHKDDVTI
jgi:hypothetical protein